MAAKAYIYVFLGLHKAATYRGYLECPERENREYRAYLGPIFKSTLRGYFKELCNILETF